MMRALISLLNQYLKTILAKISRIPADPPKLTGELAALQAQLANATAALSSEQDAHADTRLAAQQRAIDIERLSQQVHDQTVRLAEHESFRQSLEEKLKHAHDALEHYRSASREQREQGAWTR
ncbi:hypothetical protein [Burkholderia cenocepacia]|uniref:hypothetical protein n=1 Tax=Burkholderia cenocepacia TaxID=95486 RepID=UPI003EDFABAE